MPETDRENDRRAEPDGDTHAGSHPAGHTRDRLIVSRRWFLAWLAGGAAVLLGGRKLFQEAVQIDSGERSAATKGLPSFPVNTVDNVPAVSVEDWVISIDGLVAHPLRIDYSVWSRIPKAEQTVDFHCVEGWGVSKVRWSGVRVAEALAMARPLPSATHVVFHAFDGIYSDSLPLTLARDHATFLADGIDGRPLPPPHGGPVRLVVPSQLAYKSVKWVRRIELTDHETAGYWEQYGYPSDAPVGDAGGSGGARRAGGGA